MHAYRVSMTQAPFPDSVAADVRTVARVLLADLDGLATRLADELVRRIPELAFDNLPPLIRGMCEANAAAVLNGLMRATPLEFLHFTPEVEASTRVVILSRVSLTAQIRAYNLAQASFLDEWIVLAREHLGDRDLTLSLGAVTRYAMEWTDQVIEQVSADYAGGLTTLAEAGSVARVKLVTDLLGGDQAAVGVARANHRYSADGGHLAGVARCTSGDAPHLLRQQITLLKDSSNAPQLVVAIDSSTLWFWLQVRPRTEAPDVPVAPGVRVSLGRLQQGVDGFRTSHLQALDADRVGAASGRTGIVAYDDVQLATLGVADLQLSRRLVELELGRLLDPTPGNDVLRETLRVLLDERFNLRAAARRLGVHHNTVTYRARQAEKVLGHPLEERPLALGVALHLHEDLLRNAS